MRALVFLRENQEPEGCWWGRWGVNYIYGSLVGFVAGWQPSGKTSPSLTSEGR